MIKTQNIILTSTLAALLQITASIMPANAQDESEKLAMLEALSYAPQQTFNDERFEQFDLQNDAYYEHELNDAWLGMPTYAKDGKLIGYIEDALLDEEGYVTEIFVGLNNSEINLEISGDLAELTAEKVKLELTKRQVAELASGTSLASLDLAN